MGKRSTMVSVAESSPVDVLASSLEACLMREYGGPLLSGDKLAMALGYQTPESLRQAISKKTIPVPVFPIENRRGKYALTKDVARWLAERALAGR